MLEPIHPAQTGKHGYRYQFTAKHHGGGKLDDACWSQAVTPDEEFSIFDNADEQDIFDADGWYYGVLDDGKGNLRELGTWQQQIAEFPAAGAAVVWHGYPVWAVNGLAAPNRSGQHMRPAKSVFDKMEQAKLITARQRKRLYKGDHA